MESNQSTSVSPAVIYGVAECFSIITAVKAVGVPLMVSQFEHEFK